ncbi:predicted protein [Botrytis cinerea T4]|uniref:Uncharacterized protein n=1 Tax=Botryotinia fuckeliana (strain T4) TaxID=999810 RepID=G2Y5H3_BOTF4|nr:predicted protein [Botrytis cinerea T4]
MATKAIPDSFVIGAAITSSDPMRKRSRKRYRQRWRLKISLIHPTRDVRGYLIAWLAA